MKLKAIFVLIAALFSANTVASGIKWSWDYPRNDAKEFKLYCGSSPLNYQTQVIFAGEENRAGESVLDDGAVYYCAITAVDSFGVESGYSAETVVNLSAPPAPSNLNGVRITINIDVQQ